MPSACVGLQDGPPPAKRWIALPYSIPTCFCVRQLRAIQRAHHANIIGVDHLQATHHSTRLQPRSRSFQNQQPVRMIPTVLSCTLVLYHEASARLFRFCWTYHIHRAIAVRYWTNTRRTSVNAVWCWISCTRWTRRRQERTIQPNIARAYIVSEMSTASSRCDWCSYPAGGNIA